MSSQTQDWSQFTLRIIIDRPVQEVYSAWAIPKNLTHWFLEKAEYTDHKGNEKPTAEPIQKGDKHKWKWHNWDVIEKGKVLEASDKDALGFSFGKGGNVFIRLKAKNKGTELTLIQNEIPTDNKSKMDYYVGCSNGWTFWLTNLKAWLEHGLTLHAKGIKQEDTVHLVNS